MVLEVKHLLLVEAIATHRTLTNASQHVNLTQSALSHQLNELERRLGTPLFRRVGRRLVPTIAGERLLETAHSALAILRRTESSIQRIAAGHDAVLRLTTGCYTAYQWIPSILEQFTARCPKVDLQIVVDASRRPIEALLASEVDVAVTYDPPANDRLETIPLFADEMIVVVSPSHRLAGESLVRAEDFVDEHLLIYSATTSDSTVFARCLDPAGVTPRRVSAIQLTEAIIEMVKAGLGIAVLARWAVEPQLRDGSLVGLPLTRDGLRRQWSAVVVKQPATPLHVREFCRLLSHGPSAIARVHDRGRARSEA